MHAIHRTDIQVRFSDSDALGHINNASYASWVEVARLDFLQCLGKHVTSLILASLSIDYRRQVELGERIHIDSWIERIGKSSVAVAHAVYANDQKAADVKSVVVHFDYEAGKAAALDADMRGRLQDYLAAE